jgi:hypothetical protein
MEIDRKWLVVDLIVKNKERGEKEAGIKMSNLNIPFSTHEHGIERPRYGILQDANSELPPSDKDSFFLDSII